MSSFIEVITYGSYTSRFISILIFIDVVCRKKDASCVSLKAQLLNVLCFILTMIVNWKNMFFFPAPALAMIFIDCIASSIIACSMLYVEPIRNTYQEKQDNLPVWQYAIALNLLVSLIYSLMDYHDGNYLVGYVMYFSTNIGLMTSIAQLIMERNIRLQQQSDQQLGVTSVVPTLGAVRMAILFIFWSKIFSYIKFRIIFYHQAFFSIFNITRTLFVIVYAEFLFDVVRSLSKTLKLRDTQTGITSQVDRVVPLLASESSTTNIEVQEVKGTEI